MINSNTPHPEFCTNPDHADKGPHGHLSMPDPCPHFSRLDLIAARLNGDQEQLDYILEAGCDIHQSDINDHLAYIDSKIG